MTSAIGSRIRQARRRLGLTQVEMARRLDLSASYLNLIEHDQRPVTAKLLLRFREVFDIDTDALSDGGPVEAQQCGWLKDRYDLSWQILPSNLPQLLVGARAQRVVTALHQMKKLDIATLEQA